MKKLLAVLLSAFAISAVAKENITIIYGFSAADNAANYSRTLAEEANKSQDKYNFIFDVKPGGGQAVAVNYIKNTPNTIFMTSGAFWLRPVFYPNESWNVNDWRTIMTQCSAPFSVASVKYKSWKEVPTDKPLTIAISGLGVFSHMIALQIVEKYPKMILVPYKSTVDGMLATVSGQVDFVIGFVGDQETWTHEESRVKLTILGTTGYGAGKYPSLASQGFPPVLTKLDTPYNLMVPKTFNETKAKEIRDILVRAEKTQSVRASYATDFCAPIGIPENKLDAWFNDQNKTVSGLAKGVKLDK
jgi:tripartite-type tricarboxylate transporter receptor subunit TctC